MDWLKNLFIFGLYMDEVRVSPSTWSLNVEIWFYLIIGLFTYRFKMLAYILTASFLLIGVAIIYDLF